MFSDINEPVNLGNPREITIKELAGKVIESSNSKSRIAYEPLPQDDPKVRRPDISQASTILHWKPEVTLDEGLRKTIEWFKTGELKG